MVQCSSTTSAVRSAREIPKEVNLSSSDLWVALAAKALVELVLSDGRTLTIENTSYIEDGFAIVDTTAGLANIRNDNGHIFIKWRSN